MKIIVYGVHDGEPESLKNYQERTGIELTLIKDLLTADTVDQANGFTGICIKQSLAIDDEIIYQKLTAFGIKQIALRTAGFDIINFEFAKKYQLLITNVPAYSPNAVAENALAHIMFLLRKMYLSQYRVRNNNFTWDGLCVPEIRSLTIGIIGVGRIGGVLASFLSALQAKVIGYDIVINQEENPLVEYQNSLEELLNKADIVSIHTPANETTINMINRTTLEMMKDGAYLINTARGSIVNSKDLIVALRNKKLAGAGLDTLDCEVGYFEHDYANQEITSNEFKELLAMENVLITPHISFFTKTALQNMVDISLDSVVDILENNSSKNQIIK